MKGSLDAHADRYGASSLAVRVLTDSPARGEVGYPLRWGWVGRRSTDELGAFKLEEQLAA